MPPRKEQVIQSSYPTAINLVPIYSEPDIKLNLKLNKGDIIYAVEYCNLHGLWEGRKTVKVT